MRGLYIHIPFCLKKCAYCDFYSLPRGRWDDSLADGYAAAVIRNLRRYDERFDTVYFGGGTPVLMSYRLREMLRGASLSENAEITVECNPDAVDLPLLRYLRGSSVNRLSFGVQSLIDGELRLLGRTHSAETAERVVKAAQKAGFRNISADIMLGIPGQTADTLRQTAERLCGLPITHVSAYLLKIEPDTPFGRNPPSLPDEDEAAELYLLAAQILEQNGFKQYEISNFAREGFECRHNLKYWRCEEYLGIGAAAHSYYNGKRFRVPRDVRGFIEAEEQPTVPTDGNAGGFEEFAMLRLRLREGLQFADCGKFGVERETLLKRCEKIPRDCLNVSERGISLTKRGFLLSNAVIGKLLGY